jgi:glycosyltransferase involved in cell wall biosynthesis
MEKIGVLLPVYRYDNPSYFKEAIESVLNQTYNNNVVYVGVDGPVFGTLDQIIKFYKTHNLVEVIYFPKNRGLAYVLNDLITQAKRDSCKFYARMDADDICLIDRFYKQISFLKENPEVDVVGGSIEEINENSIKKGKRVYYPKNHIDCKLFFKYRDPLAHPAVMFSKSFFEKVKGYREECRKNQDTMLWYDGFLNGCKFSNIKDTVLYFRITSDFYDRRSGYTRAKKMLFDRFMINKGLGFDLRANFFALLSFFLTMAPTFVKKIAYKIR